MNPDYVHTGRFVRMRNLHLSVQTSRPEQGWIQSVWTIGRSDHLKILAKHRFNFVRIMLENGLEMWLELT